MITKTIKILLKLSLSLVFGLCVGYGLGKLTKEKTITKVNIELNKTQPNE